MISFLNALFLTTAFVELVVAALVHSVFRHERDASARAWIQGCLLMATGMLMLSVRSHLPAPVSFGVINFIMLYALALHGQSFWLLAHPQDPAPRRLLAVCAAYGLLMWVLSMTGQRQHLSLVAALSWTVMHLYLFMRLQPLTQRLRDAYFQVFVYLLAGGACLWLLRVWLVSSFGIGLATDPQTWNLLSIASVHLVLLAQQISYLIVRLSDEKRLRRKIDRLHSSLQQAWQERQSALDAQQSERHQLMRDLHDGFGSKLASLRLLVQKQRLNNAQVVDYLKEVLADLHLFADTLMHEDITLEQALVDMRHRTESRRDEGPPQLVWRIGLQGMPTVEARTALHILRVIQEAMHNALRHADARQITISAEYIVAMNRLVVSVRDDGVGLSPNTRKGQGMSSMQQRAREIGAHLTCLQARPGTEVLLTLDFEQQALRPVNKPA